MKYKKGVLLINLGTPDDCRPKPVRRYLKQFLNDPRVVDLPWYLRWPLVNLLIVPFRYKKTTEAYQKIWQQGSPLLNHSLSLRDRLAGELGDSYQVELGMRYGNPSVKAALAKLKNCESLQIIPLFPQYSSAATGSAIEEALKQLSPSWNIPEVNVVRDFYNAPGFVNAFAEVINSHRKNQQADFILFSYHGLPERQIDKSHCHAPCDRVNPCPGMSDTNLYCYRAQCYETTRLIAEKLQLAQHEYQVSFQSRLGRTPWIKPYTDECLESLRAQGVKNLAIVCPSFVADCLETLEEVNIRAREQWTTLGGSHFTFIPCINASSNWLMDLVK